MKDLQKTITVASGATVTLAAWGWGYVTANSSDFFNMLEFTTEVARGNADLTGGVPERFGALVERVIRHSLLDPSDTDVLNASDLPDLLEAIFELNGLETLLKKTIRLRERQLLAMQ